MREHKIENLENYFKLAKLKTKGYFYSAQFNKKQLLVDCSQTYLIKENELIFTIFKFLIQAYGIHILFYHDRKFWVDKVEHIEIFGDT